MDHDGQADDLDSSSTSRVARASALADAHILVDQYKDAINSSRKQLLVSTLLLHQAAADLIRKDEDEKAALATAALQASLAEARAQAAVPSPLQAMETLMAQMASVIAVRAPSSTPRSTKMTIRPCLWTGTDDKKLPRGKVWWHTLNLFCEVNEMKDTKFLACFFGATASDWFFHLCNDPARPHELTWEEAETAFLSYFDPQYGNDDLVATQRLHSHAITQIDSVRHYAQVFLTEVRIAGGLDLKSQLVLFRLGLKPTIECRCRSHPTNIGGRFDMLDQLIDLASKVEDRLSTIALPSLTPETSALATQFHAKVPSTQAHGRPRPTGGPEGDSKRQRAPSSDFRPVYTEEEKSARSLAIATKRGWKQSNGAPWDMASITAARVKNLCYKCGTTDLLCPLPHGPSEVPSMVFPTALPPPPPIPCISACATSTVHADQDTALFDATLSGVKGKVLIDSGADAAFVSARFLTTEGFATYAGSPVYVRVADGSTVLTTTRADFTVDLGKHRSKVKGAYVLPTLGPTTTALLGRSWMLQSRVCLSFETTSMKATLRTPRKTDQNTVELYSTRLESTPYSIPELVAYTLAKTALFDSVVCHSPGLMTNQTLKRWVRRQKQNLTCFEVVVTQLDDSDDAFVLNARAAQIDPDRTNRRDQIVLHCEKDFAKAFSTADSVSELRPDTPLVCPLIDPLTSPKFSRGHRLSPAELLEVEQQVKDLLAKGFIHPSSSPWGSPILFVAKPDGSWRMAIDDRKLNKVTIPNRYPLPRINDLFDQVRGAKVFSNLDLRNAYHNIRLHDSDVPKTAFITPMGLYEFKVLPFGLANAPSAFTKVMNTVFRDLIGKFVVIYLNDILIFSSNDEEHEKHLRIVLQRLEDNHLFIKREKCSFFQPEVKYLGHVLSGDGIRVNETKRSQGTLQPLPIPNAPFDSLSMDFIVGLPKSEGYDMIFVIVD
eukprot:gene18022-biopygen26971